MDYKYLEGILKAVKTEEIGLDEAVAILKNLPFQDLEHSRVDHHRSLRKGYPEVVFCQGKTIDQIKSIVQALLPGDENILLTRAGEDVYSAVREIAPSACFHSQARLITIAQQEIPCSRGKILVITAGTSDIPVAEEAAITTEFLGNRVERLYDVGVAGIHRLLAYRRQLEEARVLITVAGMDGALPSVVGGLCSQPVIAVPTSIGYGASFKGLAALLTMLNSCASGVAVVNIDNGFGAACMASAINQQVERALQNNRNKRV